jgi:hypothetical protein
VETSNARVNFFIHNLIDINQSASIRVSICCYAVDHRHCKWSFTQKVKGYSKWLLPQFVTASCGEGPKFNVRCGKTVANNSEEDYNWECNNLFFSSS